MKKRKTGFRKRLPLACFGMSMFRAGTVLFLSLLFSIQAFSQTKKISGIVTDDKGAALPGVTVSVKGNTTATTTDVLGKFSIDVPGDNAVLQFTYVGMTMQEVSVSGKTSIAISLVSTDAQNLNEVVVVGYGTQRKVTVTGAVSSVKGENLIKSPAVDLSNSLAGRLPGLVVIQTSGEPGYDGALVSIRGRNTLWKQQPAYCH